jgi:hypothetical protein
LVNAAPPPEVGIYAEVRDNYGCELAALFGPTVAGAAAGAAAGSIIPVAGSAIGGVIGSGAGAAIGFFLALECSEDDAKILDNVRNSFWYAYDAVEKQGASPGKPDNYVHRWAGVLIQDFKEGTDSSGALRTDGWGVIIGEIGRDAYFIGGGFWDAYERAVNGPNAVGTSLYPGYPTNAEHIWPGSTIRIQNFEGGSWGDAAIIGTDESAWIVAGGHWEAYWQRNGQIDLRNPLGPLYKDSEGWYTQDFEGGKIRELNGKIVVELNSDNSNTPPELPAVGHEEPTSPPIEQIEPDDPQDQPDVPQDDAPIVEPTAPPVDNSEQPPADEGDPVVPAEPDSDSCGAEPVVTKFDVPDDVVSYNINTAPVYYDIEIENRGCAAWDPGYVQVIDENNGYGLYSADQDIVEPGEVLEIENFNYFDSVGTHTLYITADNGGVLSDEMGSRATLEIVIEDLGYDGGNSDSETSTHMSQFVSMCHYYWDGSGWVENTCNYSGSTYMGEFLDEPLMDGCNYLYDGYYFYQNYDYDCV